MNDSKIHALGSRYILTEKAGGGATGEVWRARDLTADRDVAAKLLHEQYGSDEEMLGRFVLERKVMLGLVHPNIVRVRDLIVEGETLAIIMDFIEGPSMARLLEDHGTLPPREAVEIMIGVLQALAAAHEAGVVHRDVKPDNILIEGSGEARRDKVRLVDFGVAAILGDSEARRERVGTPSTMAPELTAYGRALDLSDVYSAGIVFYQMLAGRAPFTGSGGPSAIAMRQIASAPPPLPLDPALWRIISGMLAKNPAHRLPASALVEALENLPLSALEGDAAPPVPELRQWEDAASPLPSKAEIDAMFALSPVEEEKEDLAEEDVEEFDPEATSLNDWRPRTKEDTPRSILVSEDAEAEGEKTIIRNSSHHEVAGMPADPVVRKRARTGLIFFTAITSIAAVTLGVLWGTGLFTGGGLAKRTVPITTAQAQSVGDFNEAGLRWDLSASWEEQSQKTMLSVEYSTAPGAVLSGEVLLVVPGIDADQCAGIEERADLQSIKVSTDGLDIPCGFRTTLKPVSSGSKETLRIPVDLQLVTSAGTSIDSYTEWLKSIREATTKALDSLTGTRFAIQRVTSILAIPSSVSLVGSQATPVPYLVKANWRGKQDAILETDLLSSDTVDGTEVDALLDLTGGQGLDGIALETCSAARIIGTHVVAEQPTDECYLDARIGILSSGKASFGARMKNS